MAGKKKPKTLKRFKFLNNESVIESLGLDTISGQGSLVLSTLQNDPVKDWDTREVACAIERHPEFKTKIRQSIGEVTPAQRIVNYWIWKLKKLGLIRMIEDANS